MFEDETGDESFNEQIHISSPEINYSGGIGGRDDEGDDTIEHDRENDCGPIADFSDIEDYAVSDVDDIDSVVRDTVEKSYQQKY